MTLDDHRIAIGDEEIAVMLEAGLQAFIRDAEAAIKEFLDEGGVTDPMRRAAMHDKLMAESMPIARAVILQDAEGVRHGDTAWLVR